MTCERSVAALVCAYPSILLFIRNERPYTRCALLPALRKSPASIPSEEESSEHKAKKIPFRVSFSYISCESLCAGQKSPGICFCFYLEMRGPMFRWSGSSVVDKVVALPASAGFGQVVHRRFLGGCIVSLGLGLHTFS
jgi:hypothetical protein